MGFKYIYRRMKINSMPKLMQFVLIIFLPIFASCSRKESVLPVTAFAGGAGFPDQELFQAVVRLTIEDKPRLILIAPHLTRFEAQILLIIDGGVRADMYDGFGKHTALLTADEGEVVEGVNRLAARGHVVVVSDSGTVLRGDEIEYNPEIGRITSDGFVTITSPTDSLSGYGFSAAPDLTDWEIKNTSGATWRNLERDSTKRE